MTQNNYGLPEEVTAQALFDKVKAHRLTQRRRCAFTEDSSVCYYRDGEGKACAVGCLMPDSLSPMEVAGSLPYVLGRWAPGKMETRQERLDWAKAVAPHFDLLFDLQHIHDLQPPREWGHFLRELASKHGLNYETTHD